ncbi:MAG: Rv2175c family DNA-binding protein [Nocardioidaceae bacterium]
MTTIDLTSLVPSWLSLQEAADQLGVSPNRVRQLARERQLAIVRTPGHDPRVPAEFVQRGAVVKGLGGTLVVLSDHGFSDEESIEWLFTADDSLPGRPIDALREDRGKEVRRRAQAII